MSDSKRNPSFPELFRKQSRIGGKKKDRRRITNIHNQDVTMSSLIEKNKFKLKPKEVSSDEFLKPNNRDYRFECGGVSSQKFEEIKDTAVKWKAEFSKPLEQFIYPSLQTEVGDRKKYQAIHGHYDKFFKSPQSKKHSVIFSVNNVSSPTSSVSSVGSNHDTNNLNVESNLLHEEEEIDFTSFREAPLTWSLDLHQSVKSSTGKLSFLQQQTDIGEKFLRDKLRNSYTTTMINEHTERKMSTIGLSLGNDQFGSRLAKDQEKTARRRMSTRYQVGGRRAAKEVKQLNGEAVYAGLVNISRDRKARENMNVAKPEMSSYISEDQLVSDAKRDLKLFFSPDIADENDHMFDGLLYYRVQNDLNKHRLLHEEAEEQRLANEMSQGVHRRAVLHKNVSFFSSRFSRRVTAIDVSGSHENQSLNSNFITREEIVNDNVKPQEFSRIRRAINSIYNGFNDSNTAHIFDNAMQTDGEVNIVNPNATSAVSDNLAAAAADGNDDDDDYSMDSFEDYNTNRSSKYESPANIAADRRRAAEDVLLLNQLRAGKLPEKLLRQKPGFDNTKVLDMSHIGIGDELGICLATALKTDGSIDTVGLRDCRLTSKSIKVIVSCFSVDVLVNLDLSQNNLHGKGAQALATFFSKSSTKLVYLDLSQCKLRCSDIISIFRALNKSSMVSSTTHELTDVNLSSNMIRGDGTLAISTFLMNSKCQISTFDLSWNELRTVGAEHIADALGYTTNAVVPASQGIRSTRLVGKGDKSLSGCPLISIDLSANGLGDHGAQLIGAALSKNRSLTSVALNHNSIAGKACFVFSKTIKSHPSLRTLDLSHNPLGDAGARTLTRLMIRGIACEVIMKNCTFFADLRAFNHSSPAIHPYELDMTEPYQAAVLNELMNMVAEEHNYLTFHTVSVRERNGEKSQNLGPEIFVTLGALNGEIINKASKNRWVPPVNGIVKCTLVQNIQKPRMTMALSVEALHRVVQLLMQAQTEADRKNWFLLICQDSYFTTSQVQYVINELDKAMLLGSELTKVDIFVGTWTKLLDTENKYEFLCANLTSEERHVLAKFCCFEKFKFNWINPTGHWYLDLGNQVQRDVMMQIIAINNSESLYSQSSSGRSDTSQRVLHYAAYSLNLENERYKGVSADFVITKEFIANLPETGSIEFDYVSTTRPVQALKLLATEQDAGKELSKQMVNNLLGNDSSVSGQHISNYKILQSIGESDAFNEDDENAESEDEIDNDLELEDRKQPRSKISIRTISDVEMQHMFQLIGLSKRHRLHPSKSIMAQLELQLAAAKYFFRCEDAITIINSFPEDDSIQVKVITALFSRLHDLQNFNIILREVSSSASQQLAEKLGLLNMINPIIPYFDYYMDMKYLDNRLMASMLLNLGSHESSDNIKEDKRTDISIVDAYAQLGRLMQDSTSRIFALQYKDLSEKSTSPNWAWRKDLVKNFLLGTRPINYKDTFSAVQMYKELEACGSLIGGPIDLQYREFLKKNAKNKK